jgi:hypothetical protein
MNFKIQKTQGVGWFELGQLAAIVTYPAPLFSLYIDKCQNLKKKWIHGYTIAAMGQLDQNCM